MSDAGFQPVVLCRYGYPEDQISDAGKFFPDSRERVIEEAGLRYNFLRRNRQARSLALDEYVAAAAAEIVDFVDRFPVDIVQAASFAETCGLPALRAARVLGVPFAYEVRGLAHLTHGSLKPSWLMTDSHERDLRAESECVQQADWVFALTPQIKSDLIDLGADEPRTSLLPNSGDAVSFDTSHVSAFNKSDETSALQATKIRLVFAGGLTAYEGVIDLVRALILVDPSGESVSLDVIGTGPEETHLRTAVQELHLQSVVTFFGSVPLSEALERVAEADLVVLPRENSAVTRHVAPIKIVDALSLGVPCLVPRLAALADIVTESGGGWVYEGFGAVAIAEALDQIVGDRSSLRKAGERGRAWVLEHRSWSSVSVHLSEIYHSMLANSSVRISEPTSAQVGAC